VNWVIGIYSTCAAIWGIVWGASALIALADWREHRERGYAEEKAIADRGGFLGSMAMFACTPIWPVPVLVYAYKGIRVLVIETKRAAIEEAADAAEKARKRIQDER